MHADGTYTVEGITKLCEGLKGSAVTSLKCAATPKCLLLCQRALTQKQTLWGRAAHLSEVTELPLSPSQSLVMPSAV